MCHNLFLWQNSLTFWLLGVMGRARVNVSVGLGLGLSLVLGLVLGLCLWL